MATLPCCSRMTTCSSSCYEDYLADPASSPEGGGLFRRAASHTRRVSKGCAQHRSDVPSRLCETMPPLQPMMPIWNASSSCVRNSSTRIASSDARRQPHPLGRYTRPVIAELEPAHYGLVKQTMDSVFDAASMPGNAPRMTCAKTCNCCARPILRQHTAPESMYIGDVAQKRWIQGRLAGVRELAEI